MKDLTPLFENNRRWAESMRSSNPAFFRKLAELQNPEFLWIGCSDSRVPANEITGLLPGQIHVHRNIANVVVHTDLNCLSVMQYAVDILQVKHIIICGHYGCGGVQAALLDRKVGIADNWIRHIHNIWLRYQTHFAGLDQATQWDRLCELNVITQAVNITQTTVLRDAWERGQEVHVHGWIYGLEDGLLRDLHMDISSREEVGSRFEAALKQISGQDGS